MLIEALDSDTAKEDRAKPWVAAYTRGLQDALCVYINNGEACLRAGNVRRGRSGQHVIVVAAKVTAGSGEQVSSSMMVRADLWQLSVDSGSGGEDGKGSVVGDK